MKGSTKLGRFIATAIALFLSLGIVMAQNLTVKGSVVDSQGQPVVGAGVIEKGTTNGAMTDLDGLFTLNVKSGATLEVSCIGYATQDVKAAESMQITLSVDAEYLDEVVIVGFGTQKKVNLTGAVSSVDVDKTFGSKPITDVSKGLQGIVPGLTITFNTNDLDASPTMKIRGTGSVNGDNTPLILVDGVEIPNLSFVNPDNIKAISVLKDAASASIYGSRAAWGVVLITTKDGSAVKDHVAVTYSNNLSWNTPIGLPKYITDKEGILAQLEEGIIAQKNVDGNRIEAFGMYYDQLGEGIARWFDNYSSNLSNPVYKYGEDWEIVGGTPYYYRVSDPNKELYKTSFNQTHNLSINGNSGSTNYNISLGYVDTEGNLRAAKENNVQRYNINLSTNSQIKSWLNVGTKVAYMEKEYKYPYGYEASNGTMGLIYYTMRFPTFFPFGYSDGAKMSNGQYYSDKTKEAEGLLFRHGNAYVANEAICQSNDQYLSVGGNVKIQIAPGLTFYGDYTRGRHNYENRGIRQPYYVANWSFPSKAAVTTSNFLERKFVNRITNTYNAHFDYVKTIAADHNIAVMLGANAEDQRYNFQSINVNGVQNVDIQTLNLTSGNKEATVDEALRHRATAGFFGRINYNYKEKYLVEFNARYDGSSSFRPGKQWGFFPSASAGYKLSEEDFWTEIKPYVNTFKLRASYGSIGNQSLKNGSANQNWYPYIPVLSSENVLWQAGDFNQKTTASTPAAVNADMTWETIRTFDLGFDASFLNNELNASFDYFVRRNIGMLVAGNQIVRYAGIATAPLENGGDMRTSGWEFQLDYNHAFNKDFAVYGTFTIADSKSKITKWNNTTGLLNSWYEGKEIGEIWGFTTDRYFTAEDFSGSSRPADQSLLQNGNFVFGPGDIKFVDINGDNVINVGDAAMKDETGALVPIGSIRNHGDLKRIGNQLPRYEYSLRLGAMFKGFDFEVLFTGVGKREMWTNSTLFLPHSAGAQMNIFANQLDYWTEENPDAKFPRPYINASYGSLAGISGTGTNNWVPQTKYLANLAYCKLKNLTIGYTIPQSLTQRIKVEKLRVYFTAVNLFTIDHIDGVMDPELTAGWSSSFTNGIDINYAGRAVPFNRQLSCGVQLTF